MNHSLLPQPLHRTCNERCVVFLGNIQLEVQCFHALKMQHVYNASQGIYWDILALFSYWTDEHSCLNRSLKLVHNPEENHEQVKSWVIQGHNVPNVNCKDYETLPLLNLVQMMHGLNSLNV